MEDTITCMPEQTDKSPYPFQYDSPTMTTGIPTLSDIRNSLGEMRTLLESTDHIIAEYIQIQKMESVEYLARELGHDLRNGLMALAGKLYQLQRAFPGDEIRERIDDIHCVLKNLEEMIGLLQSLGQDSHSEDDFVPLDLSREAAKVIQLMQPDLDAGLQLHFKSISGPLYVLLCRGDVWRILSNLLLNAGDAMPRGGTVQVLVGKRSIDAEYCRNHGNAHSGDFAHLTVEDQGVGIPPDALPRIFDPLFSTKRPSMDGQKRGWGLAIVYTLIRRRGGWIDVESRLNTGTCFQIFLPIHR